MTNCDNPERPIGRYQDFLDTALGTDMTQAMENRHAAGVLEAIDYADQENYVEASALFLMASNTAPTDIGKQYCEILAKAANDAYNAYENALANVASETKAKEIAQASWDALSKELSIYLNFLGVYFSEREKYLEAIQYYDRAITINPSYAMAHFSCGGTKADLHLYNEASQDLKIAKQLFKEQGDLSNYQNAQKISMEIEYLNSISAQEEVLNNAQPRAKNFDQAVDIINAYFYSPDNPYLSAEEKLEVAMWYSLPGNLMLYAFFATAIYSTIYPLNWPYLIGIPLAINLVSGLINWSIYSKSLMNALYVNILLNNLITLTLRIAGIVILVSKGNYILAIAVLLSFFGFLTPFEPHLTLYVYLSKKYKMNPQYAFFKRFYNFKFPFEEVR